MGARKILLLTLILGLAVLQMGMGRKGQYDEEARAEMKRNQEHLKGDVRYGKQKNPITGIASGVKQATVDSTAGLLEDTADETKKGVPVVGTIEGTRKGSERMVDNAVKGVFKVATLGYGEVDSYKKQEPEHGSGEPTKFSITL